MKTQRIGKLLLLLSALLSPMLAKAEREVGNGGDVLLCSGFKAYLLDYYESETIRGLTLYLGPENLDVLGKVQYVLDRLIPLDEKRHWEYSNRARNFFSEAALLEDVNLVDVPDSKHVAIPVDCSIHQIAIQHEPRFPGDKRYVVNKNLWDYLSKDHQAGVILHEVIYGEAIAYGQENSIATRYFNGFLASTGFESQSIPDYATILSLLDFKTFKIHDNTMGSILFGLPVEFFPSRKIARGFLMEEKTFDVGSPGAFAKVRIHSKAPNILWRSQAVAFYPNGALKHGLVVGSEPDSKLRIGNEVLHLSGGILDRDFWDYQVAAFYSDGAPAIVYAGMFTQFPFRSDHAWLHRNGAVKCAQEIAATEYLIYDENGGRAGQTQCMHWLNDRLKRLQCVAQACGFPEAFQWN